MSEANKTTLKNANSAIVEGNNEAFLSLCADDIAWTTVGENTLKRKEAVRRWMQVAYATPPVFTVSNMIAEGNFVVALGKITVKDATGGLMHGSYSDVWRFRDGKMVELQAFVVASGDQDS